MLARQNAEWLKTQLSSATHLTGTVSSEVKIPEEVVISNPTGSATVTRNAEVKNPEESVISNPAPPSVNLNPGPSGTVEKVPLLNE